MAKDDDRAARRAEQAFAALSAKPETPAAPGAPDGRRRPLRLLLPLLALLLVGVAGAVYAREYALETKSRAAQAALRAELSRRRAAECELREAVNRLGGTASGLRSELATRERRIGRLEDEKVALEDRLERRELARVERERARSGALTRVRASLEAGDAAAARTALRQADGEEVPDLVRQTVRLELANALAAAEAAGEPARAAALHRVLGEDEAARELEAGIFEAGLADWLARKTGAALTEEDYETAAVTISALSRLTGGDATAAAEAARSVALRRRAEAARDAGDRAAARAFARAAAAMGNPQAARLLRDLP